MSNIKFGTIAGNKTDVLMYKGDSMVYWINVPFNLKHVINNITTGYKSARDAKKRFYWDTKTKTWVTADYGSYQRALKELGTYSRIPVISTKPNLTTKVIDTDDNPNNVIQIELEPKGPFSYDKNTKTFTIEMSDIDDKIDIGKTVTLRSPTGIRSAFTYYKSDKDGSGEDTYGFRYKNKNGIELLIIND